MPVGLQRAEHAVALYQQLAAMALDVAGELAHCVLSPRSHLIGVKPYL